MREGEREGRKEGREEERDTGVKIVNSRGHETRGQRSNGSRSSKYFNLSIYQAVILLNMGSRDYGRTRTHTHTHTLSP